MYVTFPLITIPEIHMTAGDFDRVYWRHSTR
jgi:hypothetical protein